MEVWESREIHKKMEVLESEEIWKKNGNLGIRGNLKKKRKFGNERKFEEKNVSLWIEGN
jgi:hypothetical protein